MRRIRRSLINFFSRLFFLVRVDGESMYPYLISGEKYFASNLFRLRHGDFAVFCNPKETGRIFVKKVAEVFPDGYIMESAVPGGASSRDFGPVPARLIIGKLFL